MSADCKRNVLADAREKAVKQTAARERLNRLFDPNTFVELDAFAKARGMKQAEKVMLSAIEKDLKDRFAGQDVRLVTAYSGDPAGAKLWQARVQEHFGDPSIGLYRLPVSISCHVGAGVKGIACLTHLD